MDEDTAEKDVDVQGVKNKEDKHKNNEEEEGVNHNEGGARTIKRGKRRNKNSGRLIMV